MIKSDVDTASPAAAPLADVRETVADLPRTLDLADVPRTLTDEWEAEFSWIYGRRFWNIGCG